MNDYPMTLFHDGNCPVCRFDIANLQARNQAGRLRFVDIAAPGFDAGRYDMSQADFMAQIRAQCADGRFVSGMDVFRLAYRAVGLGWVVAPAGWKLLQGPADALYRLFARHRMGIGRHFGWLFETLAARAASRRASRCRTGRCAIDAGR